MLRVSQVPRAKSSMRERSAFCLPFRVVRLALADPRSVHQFPSCARCKKRRDTCSYGEGVSVYVILRIVLGVAGSLMMILCSEESVEGSDQQRIMDLENKIGAWGTLLRLLQTLTVSAHYSQLHCSNSFETPLRRPLFPNHRPRPPSRPPPPLSLSRASHSRTRSHATSPKSCRSPRRRRCTTLSPRRVRRVGAVFSEASTSG